MARPQFDPRNPRRLRPTDSGRVTFSAAAAALSRIAEDGPGLSRRCANPAEGGLGSDSDVRAILRLPFLHDIAHVDFCRALTHVQFVGDDLVRFASLDLLNDLTFTLGQLA